MSMAAPSRRPMPWSPKPGTPQRANRRRDFGRPRAVQYTVVGLILSGTPTTSITCVATLTERYGETVTPPGCEPALEHITKRNADDGSD